MVLETVLGGAVGALARLAPEVMKVWDRKNERKHELAMLDKNIAAEQARAAAGLKEAELHADSAQMIGALEALKSALEGQGRASGVKWVDALTQTVRPILTYGIALPYVFGKLVIFGVLTFQGGLDVDAVRAALGATYSGADMAILSGVLNFWFLGRVFEKRS